jgi:hypothetical protein
VEELKRFVNLYKDTAPKIAAWAETNIPEGLSVLQLPARAPQADANHKHARTPKQRSQTENRRCYAVPKRSFPTETRHSRSRRTQ